MSSIAKLIKLYRMVKSPYIKMKNKINLVKSKSAFEDPTEYGLNKDEKRSQQIIVSLTSFGNRIPYVKYVVDRMLRQTIQPDKIILYLNEDISNEALPEDFENLIARGLEIQYVKDIGPAKKFYYSFLQYQDDIIITIDDDAWYPDNLIADLYESYHKTPRAISAMRCHKMKVANGKLLPYTRWEFEYRGSEPSLKIFATGVGGILYPPHLLPPETLNLQNIIAITHKADDVWLKAMELLEDIPVAVASKKKFVVINIDGTQEYALSHDNVDANTNDKYIKNAFDYYNLWRKLGI
jgi:hypothetical protein